MHMTTSMRVWSTLIAIAMMSTTNTFMTPMIRLWNPIPMHMSICLYATVILTSRTFITGTGTDPEVPGLKRST